MSNKLWKVHPLGKGPWNRPRVYTVAAPRESVPEDRKHDPLFQRYNMFWSRPDPVRYPHIRLPSDALRMQRRLRRLARIPGSTMWVFEREELVTLWGDLLRDRGHPFPRGLPRPVQDWCRSDGIARVYVPNRPAGRMIDRGDRLVSVPEELLPRLTHQNHANLFRVHEIRTEQFHLVLLGTFVECPYWSERPSPLLGGDVDGSL